MSGALKNSTILLILSSGRVLLGNCQKTPKMIFSADCFAGRHSFMIHYLHDTLPFWEKSCLPKFPGMSFMKLIGSHLCVLEQHPAVRVFFYLPRVGVPRQAENNSQNTPISSIGESFILY